MEQKVKEIIAEHACVDVSEVTNEKRIVDDFELDSLDKVEILFEVEDEFGIEIPDEHAQDLQTVQQVIDYVTQRRARA